MSIHEVFSIQADFDDALLIDMDCTFVDDRGVETRKRAVVAYRASDPYSPLTPLITQWLADHPEQEILPYVPPAEPTPEELREQMPVLSRRQFWLAADKIGISKADVLASANDNQLRIEIEESTEFHRTYESVVMLAPMLGITPEQLDDIWLWAAAA